MDAIWLLIGILLLVTLFLPWVNSSRLGSLRRELDDLRMEFRNLQIMMSSSRAQEEDPTPEDTAMQEHPPARRAAAEQAETRIVHDGEAGMQEMEPMPLPQTPLARPSAREKLQEKIGGFEQNIGTKLPVWLGAISLICAAFFLVKYSIEAGWLGPVTRVCLGGLFGGALLAAGQWIVKRDHLPNAERIAQGLVGAGVVSLYVSLYAAINLYGLLPQLMGFGGMAAVTAVAVIMSLRHGQPIAAFGLFGGLLTPALVGSEDPNALALFTYLFLLFSAMFFILTRRGWWILALIALIGVFCWSAFWYVVAFSASDALVLVLFAMAVTAAVLAVTGKHVMERGEMLEDRRPVHALNFVAIAGGVMTIVWLGAKIELALFDWSMLGLLSLAVIGMAYFQPKIYTGPLLVKLTASLILFGIWAHGAPLTNAVAVIAGFSVVYGAVPAWLMRQVGDPRLWAGAQCLAAAALYTVSYFVLDLPASFTDPFARFWGILSLVLASLSVWQAAEIRIKFKAGDTIREHLVAVYSLTATAFISLGLSVEFPWEYVPLAFAGQIAATVWVYQATRISFLKKIVIILAAVFACMNYEQLHVFSSLMFSSLFDETPSWYLIRHSVLDIPLIKLGVPAILIGAAAYAAVRREREDRDFVQVLFGLAFLLFAATAYYMGRGALYDSYAQAFDAQAGFLERSAVTVTLAVAGVSCLYLLKRSGLDFLKPWGIVLVHLAMARLIYFDMYLHNPAFNAGQFVGGWPVLNGVTMTYGAGALLAAWMVYSPYCRGGMRTLYKTLGFALLFAFVSFTVRQYFHDGYLLFGSFSGVVPTAESAELYGYSAAWLLTGLVLLTIGIRNRNKTARVASLVFMVLTVIKVFLFDAAALEGLYRVFSFLGLGVSLIALSYFYTKFVFGQDGKEAEA